MKKNKQHILAVGFLSLGKWVPIFLLVRSSSSLLEALAFTSMVQQLVVQQAVMQQLVVLQLVALQLVVLQLVVLQLVVQQLV
eukprot:scaffold201575_cov18-Tisochrysis_lutea.AAC.1